MHILSHLRERSLQRYRMTPLVFQGEARVDIEEILMNKSGVVKVDGKYWTAVSDSDIPVNSTVTILEINSTKLKVKQVED